MSDTDSIESLRQQVRDLMQELEVANEFQTIQANDIREMQVAQIVAKRDRSWNTILTRRLEEKKACTDRVAKELRTLLQRTASEYDLAHTLVHEDLKRILLLLAPESSLSVRSIVETRP